MLSGIVAHFLGSLPFVLFFFTVYLSGHLSRRILQILDDNQYYKFLDVMINLYFDGKSTALCMLEFDLACNFVHIHWWFEYGALSA